MPEGSTLYESTSMTGYLGTSPIRARARPIGRPHALERRFGNEAGSRAYDLFVPSSCRTGSLPLLVMLHGCSQTSRDFAIGTGMDELAQEQRFLVAYPDQPRSANILKSWNWFRDGDQRRGQGEPSILAGLTRQIIADFDVDPTRVYVAGLSSGGAAAAILALSYPDIYAAVGIHSGVACGSARSMSDAFSTLHRGASPRPRQATQPIPTIVFHGDCDRTVSPVNGDQAFAQARLDGELDTSVVEECSLGVMTYT
jgi:poly(hydroxyalkanoate) depolymerase family esterase